MENTNETVLETNQNGETEQNKEQKNVATNGQTSNTEQNKPAWQAKADEMSKLVGNGLFVQLAYRSDPNHSCEPVLLSAKQTANIYPIVVVAPTGLIDPVFDYAKNIWVENSTSRLAIKIATLSEDMKKVKDYQEDDAKSKQINQQKDDQYSKLMSMIAAQVGGLSIKVDKLLAAQSADNLQKNATEAAGTSTSTNEAAEKPAENVQQPTVTTEKEGK